MAQAAPCSFSGAWCSVHTASICTHGDGALERAMAGIGVLNESPLHAALKQWYARPGDLLETAVDGFVVDIVRGDVLIEIQTGHFAAIRSKLASLLQSHPV